MNATATTGPQPPAAAADGEHERDQVGVALINAEEDGNTFMVYRILCHSLGLGLERAGIAYERGEFLFLSRLILVTFLVRDRNAALRSFKRTLEDLDVLYTATTAWNNRAEGVWYNAAGHPFDIGPMLSQENFLATKARLEMGRAYGERAIKKLQQILAELTPQPPPADQ